MGHFMKLDGGKNVFLSFGDVEPSMLVKEDEPVGSPPEFNFYSDGICSSPEIFCKGCQQIDFNIIQQTKPRRIYDLEQPHCSRSLHGTVSHSETYSLRFLFDDISKITCEACKFVVAAASKTSGAPLYTISLGLPPDPLKEETDPFYRMSARLRVLDVDGIDKFKPARVWGPSINQQILSHEHSNEISIMSIAADREIHDLYNLPIRKIGAPGSDLGIAFIQSCLATCEASHDACRLSIVGLPIRNIPELPTRVLDVEAECPSRLRLFETKSGFGRFATLSHRWGIQKFLLATKSTLQELQQGIDFDLLSKTFQDAVLITRRLGIRYLWIDSLCIVQDDKDDWARESEMMGRIYENAFINFASTGSHDTSIGFLGPRPNEYQHVRFPASLQNPNGPSIYFTDQPRPSFSNSVDNAELNGRGWVLQERTLSRRTVHFANDQIYWECASCKASEDGQVPFTSSEPGLKVMKAFQTQFQHRPPVTSDSMIPINTLDLAWEKVLTQYSLCKLTFPDDKLPALQGLADRVHARTGFDYHFGHFFDSSDRLSHLLMWSVNDELKSSIPAKTRAPTWSCLATDGPLSFFDPGILKPLAKIVGLENGIPSTIPKHIALRVYGKIRTAKKGPTNGLDERFFTMFANQNLGPVEFDDPKETPTEFTCLLMFEKKEYGRGWNSQLALIMKEVTKCGEVTVFRRIGIGHVHPAGFFGACKEMSIIIV